MLRRRLQKQREQEADREGTGGGHQQAEPVQQQRGRRLGPQAATLAVPLPVTPTPAECAALLKTLAKHLLFQRSQIPYLYDELLRATQERQLRAEAEAAEAGAGAARRRRRRVPKDNRRLLKFLGKAEEALAAIDAALLTFGVPPRCFLLLGSSTSKPREAYEVLMPTGAVGPPPPQLQAAASAGGAGTVEAAQSTLQPQQQQQPMAAAPGGRPRPSRQERLCQLALRQLVVAGAELPEGTAHTVPCKLFILLEGMPHTGGSSSAAYAPGQQEQQQQQQQAMYADAAGAAAAAAAAPRGFAVKRNFRLSMRRGVHLKLLLGQRPDDLQAAVGEGHAAQQAAGEAVLGQGSGNCGGSTCNGGSSRQGQEQGEVVVHLSQLPDAGPASQEVPLPAAAAGAPVHAVSPVLAPAPLWYLCKATVKGLSSGCQEDGA